MEPRPVPPFVGRTHELATLVDAFASCRATRRGRTVVVHGPAGCGASRLVGELDRELVRRGLDHRWWTGRCTRGVPLAFEPMAGLLRHAPGDTAAWLAEGAAVGEDAAKLALLAGLATRLRDGADGAPLVAVVDDVDGADPSTLHLLAGLPPLLDDVPVLLVVSGRSAPDGGPPLGLPWTSSATEIVVNPLGRDDAAELVRALGSHLDDETVEAVVSASAGRPATAIALAAAGDAVRTSSALLTALAPDAPRVVFAAALAGGWLADAVMAEGLGVDPGVWAALTDRGILTPSDRPAAGSVPTIELWVDAARRALAGGQRPAAAAIAGIIGSAAPAANLAVAWEAAGQPVDAAAAWELAAGEAEGELAIATAAAALRRAIELGGDATLVRVGYRAGQLSLAAGDRIEADALAARLQPRLSRLAAVDAVAVSLLRYRARSEAGLPDADEHLDAALATDAPPCAARVEALVVDSLRRVLDDPGAAAAQAATAVTEARRLGDDAAVAAALGAAGLAAAIGGDLEQGLRDFDEALDAAAGAGDAAAEARLASNRVYVLWRAGRPRDVERAAAHELERLTVRGLDALGDQLAVGRAGALLCLGRYDEVEVAVAAARRMRMAADATALLDLLEADLALVRGDLERAAELVERAGRSPASEVPEVVADLWLQRSQLARARGDLLAAAAHARTGLAASGEADVIAAARLLLAWCRSAPGDAAQALADSSRLHPVGAEAAALLASIRAWHERTPERWEAAASAWEAVPAPLDAWRCRLQAAIDLGDLDALDHLATHARTAGAYGPAAEADAAWRAAGGRRAPRRATSLLTDREREVLACVAEGLTNREVAARLFISTRTVGAHLERCMAKLAVATRGAAVHEARRLGLLDG